MLGLVKDAFGAFKAKAFGGDPVTELVTMTYEEHAAAIPAGTPENHLAGFRVRAAQTTEVKMLASSR